MKGTTFEYAKYFESGSVASIGQEEKSDTQSVTSGQRIIITNTSSGIVTLETRTRALNMRWSSDSALAKKWLEPGQSLKVFNKGPSSGRLYTDGSNIDWTAYDVTGSIDYFITDAKPSNLLIQQGESRAVTNRDTEGFLAYGAYEYFSISDRQNPAVFHRLLKAGETISLQNISSVEFKLEFSGTYHYAAYNNTGEFASYGENARGDFGLDPFESLVVTNPNNNSIEVAGPYDAFSITNRDKPPFQKQTINNGESIKIQNNGSQNHTVYIDGGGSIDYVRYDASGEVVDYQSDDIVTGLSIVAGGYLVVTSTDSTILEIRGPQDVLNFSKRVDPAFYKRNIAPGQSLKATNSNANAEALSLNGTFDYALYNQTGEITDHYVNRSVGGVNVPSNGSIAFTNVSADTKELLAPFDIFKFSLRTEPVTFKRALSPEETIEMNNISSHNFSVVVSGQHHYALYDSDGVIDDFGRPIESESYRISSSESFVVSNSGISNITVSGPYDAFTVNLRSNPALLKKYLPSGDSLNIRNTGSSNFNLDIEGIYDYASYENDGEVRTFDRKRELGTTPFYSGERITVTNSGNNLLQIFAPFDVVEAGTSANPALILRTLSPNDSVDVNNKSVFSEQLRMSGTHDLMEYTESGLPNVYSRDRSTSYKTMSVGEKVAVENREHQNIEVYGPYEIFNINLRVNPVTFKRNLSQNESLNISNHASKLFNIYPEGKYDYAIYDSTGDATDEARENSSSLKGVSSGDRLAITAATSSLTVEGPYDAFNVSSRSNPALFELNIAPRESIEVEYKGPEEGTVRMTGEYDYSLRGSDGNVAEYARDQRVSSSENVSVGERLAVENSSEGNIVVYGAYDVFQAKERANPVTFHKTLSPGQSVEATNTSNRNFYLYPTGIHDEVLYDVTGEIDGLSRANTSGTKLVPSGSRQVLTNADSTAILIEGSYDAFSLANRSDPALFVKILQLGEKVEITNVGKTKARVRSTGTYDFASYDSSGIFESYGHNSSSYEDVDSGKKLAFQNADVVPIELYGAYEYFNLKNRENPVTFKRTLGPNENLEIKSLTSKQIILYFDGLYDYAKYNLDGTVDSFNHSYNWKTMNVFGEEKVALSSVAGQTVTVSGSYDAFELSTRAKKAVTAKTLQPGESVSIRNISPGSFSARLTGVYDYHMYDLAGGTVYKGSGSGLSLRAIEDTNRLIITATTEGGTVTVAVPTDAAQITDGSYTEFVNKLENGKSLEAVNTTNASAALTLKGSYDLAIYNTAGNPYSIARETTTSTITVPSGYRAVITSRSSAGTVVNGEQSKFRITEQSDPALEVLKPGQLNTVQVKNTSTGNWSLFAKGKTNWVSYSENGSVTDYDLESALTRFVLAPGEKVTITQAQAADFALWGPHDAMQVLTVDHSALNQSEVPVGEKLTATNLTNTSRTLKVTGDFNYSIGEEEAKVGQSPITIPGKAKAGLISKDASPVTVFAPYGWFTFENIGDERSALSGRKAAGKIAKLDPRRYDPQTFISDPIDTSTGAQIINRTLISAHGSVDIPFQAQYYSLLTGEGSLGIGWSHNFAIRLEPDNEKKVVKVFWNDFRSNIFERGTDGNYTSSELATSKDKLSHTNEGYILQRNDGSTYRFTESGLLTSMADKIGLEVLFEYSASGTLTSIKDSLTDAVLTLSYNDAGYISSVKDQAGRTIAFGYDTNGRMNKITDPEKRVTHYSYDEENGIVSASMDDVKLFENVFDSESRVVEQHDAKGNTTKFEYTEDENELTTTITDRNGQVQKRVHDANYQLIRVEDELGRLTTYSYDGDGNRTSMTNPLNQSVTYSYDPKGNLTKMVDHTGNQMEITYDDQNNMLSTTGPDGNKVTYTYDLNNRLLSVTDPVHGTTTYNYNSDGLLLTATDPVEGLTKYSYTNNRLTGFENAEGETTTFGYDSSGRMVSSTDSEGNVTLNEYNLDGQLVSETDPLGNKSIFSYDNQGFLATETDAKGNTISYT